MALEHRDTAAPSQSTDPALAAALAAARRRMPAPAMPPAPLRVRLRISPTLRRALPSTIVARRAVRRGHRAWRQDLKAREQALEAMRAIVGGTPRAGEVERLAEAYLVERAVGEAMFWQPWQAPLLDTRSRANLHATLRSGRGVLLSPCHTGPIYLTTSMVRAAGRMPFTVVAPWFFQEPSADKWGRRIAHWRRHAHRLGHGVVCSVNSFPVLQELLREGEVVQLYFDMPGSTQTPFLGKPVLLSTGSSRLARAADVPILPMRSRFEGHRAQIEICEPLDPRDFADAQELHRTLAAAHERLILEAPYALESPRRAGAWGAGATATAWTTAKPGEEPRQAPAKAAAGDAHAPSDAPSDAAEGSNREQRPTGAAEPGSAGGRNSRIAA